MRIPARLSITLRRFGPVLFCSLLLLRSEVALYACRSAANSVGRRMLANINVYVDPGTPVVAESISGHDVMYQAPDGEIRGILFVAHGCQHSAGDFFLKTEACPTCLGLPEERRILLRSLHRGYAVVAISSKDRTGHRCWNSAQPDRDLQPVAEILQTVAAKEGWQGKPLFALGASSGGAFVLALPLVADLAGISPQIMGLGEQHMRYVVAHMRDKSARDKAAALKQQGRSEEEQQQVVGDERPYPPTLFQHMKRDRMTAGMVKANLEMLQAQNVSTREIVVESLALGPNFLSDRIADFSADASRQIFNTLKDHGLVGAKGHLKRDPRMTVKDWQWLIRENVKDFDEATWSLQPDNSAIHEELNIAYASHEIISDHVDEMFDWWESHLQQQHHQHQQHGGGEPQQGHQQQVGEQQE